MPTVVGPITQRSGRRPLVAWAAAGLALLGLAVGATWFPRAAEPETNGGLGVTDVGQAEHDAIDEVPPSAADDQPAAAADSPRQPDEDGVAAVVRKLADDAVEAMLDGDEAGAVRLARSALELSDGMPDGEEARRIRSQLNKLVERAADAGEKRVNVQSQPVRTTCTLTGTAWVRRVNNEVVRLAGMSVEVLRCRLSDSTANEVHAALTTIIREQRVELAAFYAGVAPAFRDTAATMWQSASKRLDLVERLVAGDEASVDKVFQGITAMRTLADERFDFTATVEEAWPADTAKLRLLRTQARARREEVRTKVKNQLLAVQNTAFDSVHVTATVTDVEGRYSFGGLRCGDYLVFAGDSNTTWFAEWLGMFAATQPSDYTFDFTNANVRYLRNH
jgi:hypothetical protein